MMRDRVRYYLDVDSTPRPITEEQSAELKRLLDDADEEERLKLSHRYQVEYSEWIDEWVTGRRPIPGTRYTIGDQVRHKTTGVIGTVINRGALPGPSLIVDWAQSPNNAFPGEILVERISPVDPRSPAAIDTEVFKAYTKRELERVRTDLQEMKRDLEEDV